MHPTRARNEGRQQTALDESRTGRSSSRSIDSETLFGDDETLHIRHLGLTYTLRKTRNGKLILNK
ncbi:Hemin uptake protein hemP [Thioalkalivibrio nitratireducens DSM 14787]|uniref:Hemin uptake protein hemP n=1 Tax=Thioalkalivibrio nitratireducens (strain DSM 14787 / UNIQEM 213 / ALEN2) TaxID=1255043 RepID=L0DRS1_THIND|nr:hemin uptake protein HemP [Thioalkalivibrio nitratireducens]AGA32289.1 Hemin uptake protein hemP [Thioalkalivibrio nitratireducens DSM 14787]